MHLATTSLSLSLSLCLSLCLSFSVAHVEEVSHMKPTSVKEMSTVSHLKSAEVAPFLVKSPVEPSPGLAL
jgi:hypothetical protein